MSVAALDMGNVFGSTDAAAMQLGKALDNPTKGVTALAKAGVTFTAQQKEQIATLQASGDMLGAQKIILAEVEAQVGGTAAATATNADRMKVAFGNLQEHVGAMLIPAMEKFSNVMVTTVLPTVQKFADEWLPKIVAASKPVVQWLTTNLPVAFNALKSAVTTVVQVLQAAWQKWGDDIQRVAGTVVGWLQANVPPAFNAVKNAISTAVTVAKDLWSRFGDDIVRVAKVAFDQVKTAIQTAMGVIQGVIKTVTSLIHGDWSGVWNGLKQIASAALDGIVATIRNAGALLQTAGKAAFAMIETGARAVWASLKAWVMSLPQSIANLFHGAKTLLLQVGKDIVQGLVNGIKAMADVPGQVMGGIMHGLVSLAKKIPGVKSPSTVFHGIGLNIDEGLANGLLAGEKYVRAATAKMMNSVVSVEIGRAHV